MQALASLADRNRLEAAKRLLPVDRDRARVLDNLVRLAAELADAPMAILTIVEDSRQVFAAHYGLPDDLADAGFTPIEYSICQHAVAQGRPLIVADTSTEPFLAGHPAVTSLGVAAYAGLPLVNTDNLAVGTLCAVDFTPRDWNDDQLARLALLAELCMDELELQDHVRAAAFRHAWQGVAESTRW